MRILQFGYMELKLLAPVPDLPLENALAQRTTPKICLQIFKNYQNLVISLFIKTEKERYKLTFVQSEFVECKICHFG